VRLEFFFNRILRIGLLYMPCKDSPFPFPVSNTHPAKFLSDTLSSSGFPLQNLELFLINSSQSLPSSFPILQLHLNQHLESPREVSELSDLANVRSRSSHIVEVNFIGFLSSPGLRTTFLYKSSRKGYSLMFSDRSA